MTASSIPVKSMNVKLIMGLSKKVDMDTFSDRETDVKGAFCGLTLESAVVTMPLK